MSDNRRHPDLFTPEDAAAYLYLDSVRSLETCRKHYGLVGYDAIGKGYLYWREDLDKCALRIVGRGEQAGKLRMAR